MDLHSKFPLASSTLRSSSATFPLTHGSSGPRPDDPPSAEEQLASHHESSQERPQFQHASDRSISPAATPTDSSSRHRASARHLIEPLGRDGNKVHPRHKHSRSREHHRLSRPMSHLASSASARGLLPAWSGGRDKDRDSDNGLLRPLTRESTRTRWGSDSTIGWGTASRKGSLLDTPDQHEHLGPIRRQEIQSMEDLEKVKRRRTQGEEHLRSALSSIGTLATDVTRRLDYTYYNLLEKITALSSTISSFQELSDSASTLLSDFDRETSNLDQYIRKQINELKGFQPQMQTADVLEKRMKQGKQRVEELGNRLEALRREIDSWEQRESDWQSRTSRRLRICWAVLGSALLVFVLTLALHNWPTLDLHHESPSLSTEATNRISSSLGGTYESETWQSVLGLHDSGTAEDMSGYPSSVQDSRESLHQASSSTTVATTSRAFSETAGPTMHDPLRILDEL